jgi:hypothetical protein
MAPTPSATDAKSLCLHINAQAPTSGLFEGDRDNLHPDSRLPWRISPEPFYLSPDQVSFLEELGPILAKFYRACNVLYHHSVRGLQPDWIRAYLDQGKPERVVELGRLNRVKSHLPLVLRPDLMLTEDGMRIAELDSIPGGMGFTGQISRVYGDLGYDIIGGADGLVDNFYRAIAATTKAETPTVALVVSDESEPYREEMQWLAQQLHAQGHPVYCLHPRDLHFDEDGILVDDEQGQRHRVDAVYRFFELFDLPNIPKIELVTYFTKKNAVRLTPPPKAYLEEKLLLALLHHPLLTKFWPQELGKRETKVLQEIVPKTWIVDPRPAPPHTTIPGLEPEGQALNDWHGLKGLGKKAREYVLKPSGFSESAYGSSGVSMGHDLPEEEWAARVDEAMASFGQTPFILQKFHKAKQVRCRYYDFYDDTIKNMRGRALLRPYYYMEGDQPRLSGIQAIICPADKKILHGMIDAVLVPCAPAPADETDAAV